MKDFGVVMQEALQTRGEADIELARALAQMGTSAVDLAQQFARLHRQPFPRVAQTVGQRPQPCVDPGL